MADLALRMKGASADLAIEGGDLALDDGLETAVLLSLFSDRRAGPDDVLPDADSDLAGWWADELGPEGDRIGSRLWLLRRERQSPRVAERAEAYAREALAWLVEDRVAERVEVAAEFVERGRLRISIEIHRPRRDPVEYRFNFSWAAQEQRI